jgi:hypothetical protein
MNKVSCQSKMSYVCSSRAEGFSASVTGESATLFLSSCEGALALFCHPEGASRSPEHGEGASDRRISMLSIFNTMRFFAMLRMTKGDPSL